MSTQLRITPDPYSVNINFDEDEYKLVKFDPVSKSDVQIFDRRPPRVLDNINGSLGYTTPNDFPVRLYEMCTVQILHYYGTTQAKVKSIFDYELGFRVYYEFEKDNTNYYEGILDPNYSTKYWYGQELVIVSTLKFYPISEGVH